MFKKIDSAIYRKIRSLSSDKNFNNKITCIVYSNEYFKTRKLLQYRYNNIFELPFISSFVVECSIKDIYKLANLNCVKFISSDAKVNSLIYESKKFIGFDNLNKKIKNIQYHTIAVIDTGLYPHIDFCLGKNKIIKFVDLINNKSTMYDDNGHGTFVAGVLCANSITNKYNGIDNYHDIIVIKALDSDGETTSIKILQAMQWILDNKDFYNIKVVCMSFGSVLGERDDPLMKGAEVLWDNNICVVCAGGNSGPENNTIMSPGASKKIITVGSLDNILNGNIDVADFSSRGPVFNYYKPDMLVPGVDIISTNIFSKNHKFYTKMSGTSVSTPMIAGVVSLLFDINPNYTPNQIKYMLIKSCIRITGDMNSEGYGYLDLNKLVLL